MRAGVQKRLQELWEDPKLSVKCVNLWSGVREKLQWFILAEIGFLGPLLTAVTIIMAMFKAPAAFTSCFSPQRVLHRHFYCQRSWLFCLWKSMQGYLNPLLWASQLKRNTNNTKIPQFKLSERPLPFLLVLSGGPRHTGSNVCVRLMGQPSSKVRIQLVTVSRQNWQALTEESRAGALKHSHIAYYTAKIYNRGHQQELCPDVFSNSLLIRIASALQIQLNHDSDFFPVLETLKYAVKVFSFFFSLKHC